MLLCGWFGTRTGVRGLLHPVPCPFICLLPLLYHALSKNTRFISDYFTRNSGGRWPPLRFFWTSPRRKAPVPPQGKASFRKEVPQFANWGGGLYFAAGEMYEINKVCKTLFTSYVLLRKTQSSVSLRLTAPFKRGLWSSNGPASAKKPPSPAGQAFHPPGGRCPRRGRMRGRGGQAVLSIRGDTLTAPSSVTACGRATFPLKGGRLFGCIPEPPYTGAACGRPTPPIPSRSKKFFSISLRFSTILLDGPFLLLYNFYKYTQARAATPCWF